MLFSSLHIASLRVIRRNMLLDSESFFIGRYSLQGVLKKVDLSNSN